MDKNIITKIDEMIEASKSELARSTIEMINIKSVTGEPKPGAPFGEGPRAMLEYLLKRGKCAGFYPTDYGVGVGSLSYKDEKADLGIWLHADVVPEGEGWQFEPYDAVEYKGCVIGRGASDNKGQIAATFRLFEIFKELGIELSYNPAMYIGTSEEIGMMDVRGIEGSEDAKGFINVAEAPALSLVPDSDFPVACGGKGSLDVRLKSNIPLKDVDFSAGMKGTPFRAIAKLSCGKIIAELIECTSDEKDGLVTVSATSRAIHGAYPDPDGNMITKLTSAIIEGTNVCNEDKKILDFLRRLSLDVHGEMFDINPNPTGDRRTATALFTSKVTCNDGYPEIYFRIRFTNDVTVEKIRAEIERIAKEEDFSVSAFIFKYAPYYLNPKGQVITSLCNIANSVTGEEKAPYMMGGGTYANCIPNAIPFGMSGNLPPDDFEKGRGSVHGVDEAVSLDRLVRAMKIYARALLWLDGKDFEELKKDINA